MTAQKYVFLKALRLKCDKENTDKAGYDILYP